MNWKRMLPVLLVIMVVIGGIFLFRGLFFHDTSLQGSGTVEARNIRVGSEVGGRIDQVLVREGDTVQAGQVLVTFDSRELGATLEQARAAAEKAASGSRPEEITAAREQAAAAKADYEEKKNGYRKEDVAAAQADLDRAKADEIRAQKDFERYAALEKKEEVSKQQRDTAEAAFRMAHAQAQNAQQKLDELHHGYRSEEIAAAEARYKEAQANYEKIKNGNRREDVDLAKAAYAYDQARFRESQVSAPSAATVEVLDVRPGDLVAPNTPIATLLEKDQIYVRIYIPETEIGKVQVGQKAEIRVDSFPNAVLNGEVEQINQQAEFLPRNVQTREERVHQVFGVKVRIDDARVLPGMAADVKLKAN